MDHFDVIVVGAGTAGCVIAGRLSERTDARVLLLEAGGAFTSDQVRDPQQWPTLGSTEANWGDSTVPQAATGHPIAYTLGRGLGGSSLVNAMAFLRGHRSSYDSWAAQGAPGWGFDDLLPYFRRSETAPGRDPALRGTDGPALVRPAEPRNPFVQTCLQAALECGYRQADDVSGGLEDGFGRIDQNIVDGQRQSAADAYLATTRANLRVVTGATVTAVRLEGDTCTGVDYLGESGETVSVAGGEVVLTAGAIGSAKLLMLSGVGPADHLRELGIPVALNVPGVGSNLQDHPTCMAAYRAAGSRAPRIEKHFERVSGLVRSALSTGDPDLQVLFQDTPVVGPRHTPPPHGYAIRVSLMRPYSRGTVRLASSDPQARTVIDPRFYSDERDLHIVGDGLRIVREIGQAKALAGWRKAEFLPGPEVTEESELDAYIRASLGTYHHPVGTCRMGADEDAVVDTELRVRGIHGLRIADASIMPTIPSANTNATVYAIGERAAELIATS